MASSTNLSKQNQISYNGYNFWAQNAGDDYSLTQIGSDTFRFEVRQGDAWSYDPAGIDRSEIASQQLIANGTPVEVSYGMTIEQGAANTAAWTVLGQFHQDDADPSSRISPPFTVQLNGEKMQIVVGYTGPTGVATYVTVYTDATNLVRGHNYAMDVQAVFDPKGNGRLIVTRDGATIVNYSGPLGYASQSSVYWKEGIYRSDSPQTLAVDYSNLTMQTGTPVATSTTASPGPQAVSQYDASGNLLSTTSYVYDANGNVTQQSVVNADGSGEVKTWAITGQTYVFTDQITNSAGKVTSLTRTHADGTLDYQQTVNAAGVTTTATYDAKGNMATLAVTQPNTSSSLVTYFSGTTTPSSYQTFDASGNLTLNQVFFADGSKKVQRFGITGQTYTTEKDTYDASGRMIVLARFHADGSQAFLQTVNATGDTTTSTFDATGGLLNVMVLHTDGSSALQTYGTDKTRPITFITYDSTGRQTFNQQFNSAGTAIYTEIDYADGSKKIQHAGIQGQAFTSDKATYDSTGKLLAIARYRADGSQLMLQTVNAKGDTFTSNFDASGALANILQVVRLDGSRILQVFGTNKASPIAVYTSDGTGRQTSAQQWNSAGQPIFQETDNADGSKTIQHFAVTGQNYTSDMTVYDTTGKAVSVKRFHADGTLAYQQTSATGGDTVTSIYDASGQIVSVATVHADGSSANDTYGTDKTHPATHMEYNPNGVLTLNQVLNADGTTKIQHFGITGQTYVSDSLLLSASGQTLAVNRYHADKSLDFNSTLNSDGSTRANSYDATGHLTQSVLTAANGALSATLYAVNQSIASGSGNDTFSSFHNDTFVFGPSFGSDTIYGFNAGNGAAHDTIQLPSAQVPDFQHLSIVQSRQDAVVQVTAADTITLKGVSASALTASNFAFA